MIYIVDDFLDKKLFNFVNKDLKEFKEIQTPGKKFWIINPSEAFIEYMIQKISLYEGRKIINCFSFFREAKKNQDNDWRIHNDSYSGVYKEKPDRALVLFMSNNNSKKLNGTAFWSHKKYGEKFPENKDINEANRMLKEDANDLSKWQLKSVIGHNKNRLISYPCEYFHSKYPNEFKKSRKVFVMFYKYNKNV
tara:strand:- start:463 stop:1041 length:579 start_codon:yes stop_codon:yes gene_type:complete